MTASIAFRICLVALATGITALMLSPGAASPAPAEPRGTAAEVVFDRGGWIYVMHEGGTGLRRLVRGSGAAWSPDGTKLAFSRFDRLFVVGRDGRGERELAAAGRGWGPAWSPDGTRIAFTSRRSGRFAVYVANADGTRPMRLIEPADRLEESDSPAWSPDGTQLAFAITRAGFFNPEIYVVRPDGAGLRRLTHTRGSDAELGDDGMPHWSPDGRRIVFSSNRTQDGAIWAMQADGSGERKLYDARGSDELQPAFSPDGRRIAFTRLVGRGEEIWLMRSNGGGARKLTEGRDPAWRPAGVDTAAGIADIALRQAASGTMGPGQRTARSCGKIVFTRSTEDVATNIRATRLSCAAARALVRRVRLTHNFYSGPRRFHAAGFDCSVVTETRFLPVGHYTCSAGKKKVTWSKR